MNQIIQLMKKIKNFFFSSHHTCRLVDFNINKQEVVFRLKMKAPIFKLPLDEAITTASLIYWLSPLEACWLGGHYGKQLRADVKNGYTNKQYKKMDFILKNSDAQYRIISLTRDQAICYFDKENKQIFTEYPLSIVNNKYLISKFDSTQACYIGILAGLCLEKAMSNRKYAAKYDSNIRIKQIVKLRLVEQTQV